MLGGSKLDEYIEEIFNIIKEKVDKKTIKKKLEEYIAYGVPLEQAKQTLIKQYNGTIKDGPPKKLKDIKSNERSLNLVCQVVSINPKDIEVKGEKRRIFYGFLGDETGTHTFTSWKDFDINKGDVIQITNAYSKEWQKQPQINFSEATEVKKVDSSAIEFVVRTPAIMKIIELRAGMGNVEVTGKLLSFEERIVTARGQEKSVYSGIIGDSTGKIPYTSWKDFSLKQDDVIKIKNGYIKSWRGAPQLVFDDNSQVEKLDNNKISLEDIKIKQIPISTIIEREGGLDMEIAGTVIEIRPGSGLIFRCPECNRALKNSGCGIHGDVEGLPDLRIKAILDDGTGSINAIFNREQTEKILDMKLEECKKMAEETLAYDVIENKIESIIFARPLKIMGNAFSNEFGVTLLAKEISFISIDIQKEVDEMLKELGE